MKTNITITKLLDKPQYNFEKFHRKSNILKLSEEILDPKFWPKEWKTVYYKGYSRLKVYRLPKPKLQASLSFKKILTQRKSTRKFTNRKIDREVLSTLFYYSAGLKINNSALPANRFYPSAGGRYPLEIYVLLLNTQYPRGLYHYYLKGHLLELLLRIKEINTDEYFNQPWIKKASMIILVTAIFNRTTNKYGERGYRYVLTESGHMGQNIYLLAASLGLSCCAIGGYVDCKLNELIDIDGIDESVIGVYAVGT